MEKTDKKGRKELVIEKSRMYLVHTIGNVESAKVDVTAVWHFFKEFQEYLSLPHTPEVE